MIFARQEGFIVNIYSSAAGWPAGPLEYMTWRARNDVPPGGPKYSFVNSCCEEREDKKEDRRRSCRISSAAWVKQLPGGPENAAFRAVIAGIIPEQDIGTPKRSCIKDRTAPGALPVGQGG